VSDEYRPLYKWRETWPGEGHQDFSGFDGEQSFGRIQLDQTSHSNGYVEVERHSRPLGA
jgi:hypothetical protein